MRKQELMELKAGQVVLDTRNNVELVIAGIGETKVILTNGKEYSKSTLKRYFKLVEEEVQEDNTVEEKDDTQDTQEFDVESSHSEQQEEQDTEADTANKITSEDIIYIIEHSNCDAVVKKQYIGAYREGYKGAVCMVRTTRKGNTHIDIKQGIFDSLAESIRTKLQTKYAARVYDKTRGYIRLFEVDDLAVLQDLILFVLGIA